jgi:hypothetical protein
MPLVSGVVILGEASWRTGHISSEEGISFSLSGL